MMNEKDLQALKEMTGLVSEKEIAAKKQQVINTQDAAITTKQKEFIGCYVVVTDGNKTHYALVDSVFSYGRLGVIYSEGDTWTASLVQRCNVRCVASDDELIRAKASALAYCKKEKRSCEFINARHTWSSEDNKARFEAHYADVCKWYDYIAAS